MNKVKSFFLSILILFSPAFLYLSCSDSSDKGNDDCENEIQIAEEEIFSLSDVNGKNIYAIITNPSSQEIEGQYLRSITSVSGIEGLDTSEENLTDTSNADAKIIESSFTGYKIPVSVKDSLFTSDSCRSASADQITQPEKITEPIVDETAMKIYVDNDLSMQTYRKKASTLRAKGKYCYVWVVDSYYSEEEIDSDDVGNKVDSATAQALADKFDSLYPVERYLFGNESENIFYNDSIYSTMEEWSATGSMVNIVLYDIGCDRYSLYSKGVMGYFYDKDYYIPVKDGDLRYSNQGKYFYVDTYYAVKYADTMMSTLAHEFQHMIAFGVEKQETEEVWYKEMLALHCEDALYEFLEIPQDASPRYRLPSFNSHYVYSGIEYNTSEGSLSYATLYAFGAWCARNFGGAEYIKKVALCPYANENAVVYAVNAYGNTDYSFEDILNLYTQSLVNPDSDFTLNRAGDENLIYADGSVSYSYPLSAIDLSSADFHWTSSVLDPAYITNECDEESEYINPAVFSYGYMPEVLRPNGFILLKLGTAQEDNVSLTFSSGNAAEELHLLAY
ncbi:hypothetical protein [Treponema sp.]|uniref:hypothetical protein n=1 Tax=Treponema sp. TaxID=166 RepID=UPI0025CF69AA|nr:hypothetical protein [Treponema sp.]MCR5219090.1 hypothetical protein [Treponema sp.]